MLAILLIGIAYEGAVYRNWLYVDDTANVGVTKGLGTSEEAAELSCAARGGRRLVGGRSGAVTEAALLGACACDVDVVITAAGVR